MNAKPLVYKSDVRPIEFSVAVVAGGVGSATLSALRLNPLISVGYALTIMGILASLRWRIASENKDHQSLEAFAEDIYLLGYLLTLAALLGLAPRLMSDDTNLFNIAGLKLVTTVVGLGLMMVFRQTARRWAQEEQVSATDHFTAQERSFSESVRRLNESAESLSNKATQVVQRFDPVLLLPMAEWSSRAVEAYSGSTKAMEAIPKAIESMLQEVGRLGVEVERLKVSATSLGSTFSTETAPAAGGLATRLGQLGATVESAGHAAADGLTKVGKQAEIGIVQFGQITQGMNQMRAELGKVESVLKELVGTANSDPDAPVKRLTKALEDSASQATSSREAMDNLKARLDGLVKWGDDSSKRVAQNLEEDWTRKGEVQREWTKTSDELVAAICRLEQSVTSSVPTPEALREVAAKLSDLHAEMKETNSHLRAAVIQGDGNGGKRGFFTRILGG